MKTDKLISMCDYVLNQKENQDTLDNIVLTRIYEYAQFYKTPLSIDMFVPAVFDNGSWRILEFIEFECWDKTDAEYNEHTAKYFDAKDKVLFDGFEVKIYPDAVESEISKVIKYKNCYAYHFENGEWKQGIGIITVENLVQFGLTLTENTRIKLGFTNQ